MRKSKLSKAFLYKVTFTVIVANLSVGAKAGWAEETGGRYTSTAGQTRSTDSTTTTTRLTSTVPLQAGQSYDPAALQTYYQSIWTNIRKNWWVPEELFFKQVKVKMVIEKDGRLSSASLANASGDSRADNLALIAIKRSSPYGPLPAGLPAPFSTIYTIGFASNKDRDFVLFNGARYGKGEHYTLPTGTKVGHSDRQLSDLDKQFHIKKEAALIKMNKLYDAIAAEDKAAASNPAGESAQTNKKALLINDYANCLIEIQEQGEARNKLKEALEILDKNQAESTVLYPTLAQLAQLDYSVGDLSVAEPLFKRALAIQEDKAVMESYAKLLYKQNRAAEADEIYKKIKLLK